MENGTLVYHAEYGIGEVEGTFINHRGEILATVEFDDDWINLYPHELWTREHLCRASSVNPEICERVIALFDKMESRK